MRSTRRDRTARQPRGARLRGALTGTTGHEQATSAETPQAQQRAAGDDELTADRATYNCSCGYVFQAPVSASVACPHCGSEQAW